MRRTIALLLAILMLLTVSPVTVFAADETNASFALTGGSVEVDGTEDKPVTVVFSSVANLQIVGINGSCDISPAEGITLSEFSVPWTVNQSNPANVSTGMFGYADDAAFAGFESAANASIVTMTYTVDKDMETGTYPVTFTLAEYCNEDYMESFLPQVSAQTYTTTISVTNTSTPSGGEDDSGSTTEAPTYTASVTTNAENNTVVNGQEIIVKVNVGTSDFASANVVMSYDSTKLQYNGFTSAATDAGDGDQAAEISSGSGTLTITDFGGTITKGEGVYQVTFKAIDGGQTQVTLESAAFSTQAYAETDNLVNATIDPKTQTVNINHKITVNGTDVGSAAADGTGSYEFTISDYDPLYDYTVSVTMGTEQVTPESLGNGKYKVDPISDDLTITYTKGNRNAFGVTWAGDYADLEEQYKSITSVAVGESLTIALPDGAEATADQEGYSYSAVIKIGETEHKQMSSGEYYTIPSDAIDDDITITVTKTTNPALGYNYVTVTIPADSGVEIDGVTGTSTTVKEGDPVTLKLTAADADLYNYSVKMGDQEILNNTTTSVIINPTNDVTITVTKALKTDSATATLYLELNGKDMYLLKIGGTEQVNGKVYTYTENGKTRDMFWSAKYNAYCTLIVVDADTTPVLTVGAVGSIAGNFGLKDGTAEEVDYTMDVNKSGTKDINDAQLVWNMYSNKYQGVTENVTIEKFLRADVNDTVGVDSTDAQAIIG